MNSYLFSHSLKKGTQIVLLLAVVLLNFGVSGTGVAYAAPPVHDDFNAAKVINAIEYHDFVNTTEATPNNVVTNATVGDPDNIACQDEFGGISNNAYGYTSIWYKYTPQGKQGISLNATGTYIGTTIKLDLFIAVWKGTQGNLELVVCNDETSAGFPELSFEADSGVTYYIEIAQYNNGENNTSLFGGNVSFNAFISNTDVRVGGALRGRYFIPTSGGLRRNFINLDDGPVEINNVADNDLIASERVIYTVNKLPTSFSEMMGLPNSQLHTTYWMPWYNNVDLETQLRVGNVTSQTVNVTITIGGQSVPGGTFSLAGGASTRLSFPGVNNGPVKIVSTGGNIVASERVIYKVNRVPVSFTEMMGLPDSQLTNTYWMPWYNNVDLDTQLRIGNVATQPVIVRIYIAGTERTNCVPSPARPYPYNLGVGQSVRVTCPGVNNGPVRIQSTGGNIVAAERVIYRVNRVPVSFTEMMGLPATQLSNTYWMPWYNNIDLDTQLRIGNVSGAPVQVTIKIGGVQMGNPIPLGIGQSTRLTFPSINGGPVQITTNGGNIVAAERVIYRIGQNPTSFSEMMGMPSTILDSRYWMPWYNNVDLDTQLRFALP